jgi:hypothetical protein
MEIMAKILVKAVVSQLVYIDPANYGQRDDVFDLEDAAETDFNNVLEGAISLDELFDGDAATFSFKYEEAGE